AAPAIEPSISQTVRLDHQRVLHPSAGRVAVERRFRILRQRTSLREDVAVRDIALRANDDEAGELEHFPGRRECEKAQRASRLTQGHRIIFSVLLRSLLDESSGPGLIREPVRKPGAKIPELRRDRIVANLIHAFTPLWRAGRVE